jgi:ABC-type Mn2+/Zn2+ transport system ATPase subunit
MAKIKKIQLSNFKGAESVSIDLHGKVDCPVVTLIGLNESGKTTILEGLSHFLSGNTDVASLFEVPQSSENLIALIPIHRKAAYSGEIKVAAEVLIEDSDKEVMRLALKVIGYELDVASVPQSCTVTRAHTFEDSLWKSTANRWGISFKAAQLKKTKLALPKIRNFSGPSTLNPDPWRTLVAALSSRLPRISYFPTFLVGLPKRIYLRSHKSETAVNRYYRTVLQDILESLDESLSLEKHVCKRIDDFVKTEENWFSAFFSSPIKPTIDSVFQKIGSAVTREVLGSWKNVFQLPISAKNVQLEWQIDTEQDNLPYASFYVSDGESRYEISERSLGFRWFFSFLLFTSFQKGKGTPTLMLFDEPAANLHAKAQAELLKSFEKIVKDGNRIIYSTHSHHMIEPRWLSGAYIVENTSIDYDQEDTFGLATKPTNIQATPYRQFVSAYPTRSSYFQPVIEKLGYSSPQILGTAPFVIVEGITDFYALKLAQLKEPKLNRFCLLPGDGAGSSGPLVSLLLGRSEKFCLLFDDDKEGKAQALRFRTNWILDDDAVFTLARVSSDFSGMQLESLLGEETIATIKTALNLTSKPSKQQIGIYLAEACAIQNFDAFEKTSYERLNIILRFLNSKF